VRLEAFIRAFCLFLLGLVASHLALSQTATPPMPSNPTLATGQGSANSASNGNTMEAGRDALNLHLDQIAGRYLAERAARVNSIRTRGEAEAYRETIRKKMLSLIGGLPERTPLNPKILGETSEPGFRIRKVLFESQPDFPVTALLYLPSSGAPGHKHPAILMTPGHGPRGKAGDANTAAVFARNGFVVLSYDTVGEGERLQYSDPGHPGVTLVTGATGEHAEASLQPLLIGDTPARFMVWDAIRGVDYLAQLPEVDPKRIGAFGCSGGGTITALLGALDTRIVALGVACYITSFDTLLPTLGPQDAEQSTPRWVSSGLDFPDWIEAAAPRPYAVISTYSDMFPFAGARASVAEARRFYAHFSVAGAEASSSNVSLAPVEIPTEPALNVDTADPVSPTAPLQFITGPGHHGALTPILDKILSFFVRNLEPDVDAGHPILPATPAMTVNRSKNILETKAPETFSEDVLRVTPTGQVATSYPGSETIFTLNRKRAAALITPRRRKLSREDLARAIRSTTGTNAMPGASLTDPQAGQPGTHVSGSFLLRTKDGLGDRLALQADIALPASSGRHPAVLLLVPDSIHGESAIAHGNQSRFESLAAAGNIVLAITPCPSPPGTEDTKSPLLGPFYLLGLRAQLVGRTLLGLRIDDVVQAVDYLASRPDVDPTQISAVASGHMGLVLLHTAVLDPRLGHIAIDHVLLSYHSLLDTPMPVGVPEDILPGVLLHYDLPDLVDALRSRVKVTDPLNGGVGLSQTSTSTK
jgi:cephalosporin-C deacetylase-like acetyl esterase